MRAYCVKHTINIFEVKINFVLKPKKLLQKWLECGSKKSIFTVKVPLIAPTLGGPGAPPDLYIGGAGPPLAPPVPTPMRRQLSIRSSVEEVLITLDYITLHYHYFVFFYQGEPHTK